MSLLENYTDIGTKLNLRYAIYPISGISGSPAPTTTTIGSNVTGYIYSSTSGGTITIGTAGSYCAILVQKGFNGGSASTTTTSNKDGSTIYYFYGGYGGGTGQMVLAYGWIPAGTYSYSIDSTTSFNGLVASNTSPSTTITTGFGSAISYASIVGATPNFTNSSTGSAASVAGSTSQIVNFPAPLNGITVIGGSGASGASAPSSTTTVGGGAGRTSGLGGLANGGSINGRGQDATVYGAGGGGAAMFKYGSTVAASGIPGLGGPGCVIIVPFELLISKNITNPTTFIDVNYFNMGGYSLTNLLDERLVPCLDSNSLVTYSVPSPSLVSFGTLYPFGSSDTITYLNGVGFKTLPFALTGSNSIKYAIVRNTSTNLYYMTLFAENTCTLTTNITLSSIDFICCGNGGTSGACFGTLPSFGAGGGGIGTGTFAGIASGSTISITRANGSDTVLVTDGFTQATATAGGNSTTSAAGASGTATTAGYTSLNGGAGGSGSGTNGSSADSTSITVNSGYVLTSTGFGGGGQAGTSTNSNGGGGSYGFGGGINTTIRPGNGYGAGAGGQRGSATTPDSQAGKPGVVILSFVI
jgi:hypothetical protein